MSSPSKALVLGANGQDGSYLSEILCALGLDVVAVGRSEKPRWPAPPERYQYRRCDLADTDAVTALLRATTPDIVFHFAAIHGPAGFDYESVWREAHMVNTLSVHAILEHARCNPGCSLVYASSSKVFGAPLPVLVDETTPRLSTCIYSATKNAAHGLIEYYRARHGVTASALYLFNHESCRRGPDFFIPRIVRALIDARASAKEKTRVHTLDFTADWGDAREYMDIAAAVGLRGLGEDYVLATGKSWNAREMVKSFFARHGMDYADHIQTTTDGPAPAAPEVSIARLRDGLGRIPTRGVLDVLDDMLRQGPVP